MVAVAIQRRGGSTAAHASFTGLQREATIDTDKMAWRIHDGATAGGWLGGGYKRTETGATQRSMFSKAGEIISVKDFGAVGDGSTDDTAAFAATIAAVSDFGTVYVPEGVFKLTSSLSISGKTLDIVGEGVGCTELRWTTAGGISFNGGSEAAGWKYFGISEMSLTTSVTTAAAAAITCAWTNTTGTVNPSARIENVYIRGRFTKGVSLTDAKQATLSNVQILGDADAPSQMTAGIYITSSHDATDYSIHRSAIYWCTNAIHIVGTGGDGVGPEGVVISNTHMVAVDVGVYYDAATNEPSLMMTNCHVAARVYGAYLENATSQIVNCGFYARPDATAAHTGIFLRAASTAVVISGCTFLRPLDGHPENFNGIIVETGATDVNISGCVFWNCYTAIWFQTGTERCSSFGNVFRTTGNVEVLNDAAANNGTDRNITQNRMRAALVSRSSNQSVGDNSESAVSFSTQHFDTAELAANTGGIADLGSHATRLTVPQGATMVELAAQVTWDVTTGTRAAAVYFKKNGSAAFAGNAQQSFNTAAGTLLDNVHTEQNISTGPLNVAPGDYFEVAAYQLTDAAAAINVLGEADGYRTWFAMKVIE